MSNDDAVVCEDEARKCSSCKCTKSMKHYSPIIVKGKTVFPKTCIACRTRRNDYYSKHESLKRKKRSQAARYEAIKDGQYIPPVKYGRKSQLDEFTGFPSSPQSVSQSVCPKTTNSPLSSLYSLPSPFVCENKAKERAQSQESVDSMIIACNGSDVSDETHSQDADNSSVSLGSQDPADMFVESFIGRYKNPYSCDTSSSSSQISSPSSSGVYRSNLAGSMDSTDMNSMNSRNESRRFEYGMSSMDISSSPSDPSQSSYSYNNNDCCNNNCNNRYNDYPLIQTQSLMNQNQNPSSFTPSLLSMEDGFLSPDNYLFPTDSFVSCPDLLLNECEVMDGTMRKENNMLCMESDRYYNSWCEPSTTSSPLQLSYDSNDCQCDCQVGYTCPIHFSSSPVFASSSPSSSATTSSSSSTNCVISDFPSPSQMLYPGTIVVPEIPRSNHSLMSDYSSYSQPSPLLLNSKKSIHSFSDKMKSFFSSNLEPWMDSINSYCKEYIHSDTVYSSLNMLM